MKQALLALSLAIMLTLPAHADRSDHDLAREAVRSGQALPLAEILLRVRPRLAGEIIRVEFEREHGRYIYEFRVISTEGRIRRVHVDAATAAILDEDDR